jgi:hypothetical protein
MLMGNFLFVDDLPSSMATNERESVAPAFGIAHATVVPENFDPEEAGFVEERPAE